jgi:tellurite resistance protein
MKSLRQFSGSQKMCLLQALVTVARADRALSDRESAFIEAIQQHLLDTSASPASLPPISPADLQRSFSKPEDRRVVMATCVLIALVDGEARVEQETALAEFEHAFGLQSAELEAFRDIRAGRIEKVSATMNRESFGGHSGRLYRRRHPFKTLRHKLFSPLRLEQTALAKKYRALGILAEGTLGRCYFDFIESKQYKFPGEVDALAEHLAHHDFTHVLGEFGTTPGEELLTVAFQAGAQSYNPFWSMLTAISLFHLGLASSGSKVARQQKMKWDPDPFFQEFVRGSKCSVDLSDGWDHWRYLALPIEEVRALLNIEPRAA